MHNYILFVLQEANFQSRSIIVSTELFLNARNEEYLMLQNNSTTTITEISKYKRVVQSVKYNR